MEIKRIVSFSIDNQINRDNNILLCLPSLINENTEYIRKFSKDHYINDIYNIDYRNINYKELQNKINNNMFRNHDFNLTDKDLILVNDAYEEYNSRRYKYGFTNLEGKLIIPCIYDEVSVFFNGIALAKLDNHFYYIDKDNNIIKEVNEYNMSNFISFSNNYNFYYPSGKCSERIRTLDLLSSDEYIELNGIVAYDIINSNVYMVSDYKIDYRIINNNKSITISSDEVSDLISSLIRLQNKESVDKKLIKKKST